MKEKILEVLELTRNNGLSKEEIYKKCGYTNYSYDDFLDIFNSLLSEKLIYCVKSDSYTLNPFVEGIFRVRRSGDCYVESGDIKITLKNGEGCFDGDKVLVRITDFNTYSGTIKNIIERKGIVAEVKTIANERFAFVGKDMYKIDLPLDIVDGMMIGIKIDKTKSGKFYHATLDRIIGHKNAPGFEEMKILYSNEFPVSFSEESIRQLNDISNTVDPSEVSKRVDLRNKMIFTIDGDDTKDIDDAISLEVLDNGNRLLGVHIADVSFYVPFNSSVDLDARERGTSVYMPGKVSPMYDPKLSNGICSLNPLVDRLALSCDMEIDNDGNVVNYKIYKSVIHSNKQMTYKNVNHILDENIVPEGYEDFSETLKEMKILADILRNSRVRRGMLNFDLPEIKILVDNESNKVTDIVQRNQGTGESLIEDFMLAANETVATYIYNMTGINFIYRVHDFPNEERLKTKLSVIKSYGFDVKLKKINTKDPKFIQNILNEFEDSEDKEIFTSMILRCMAKASYMVKNGGHFGIGVDARRNEAYTHFTSPIRRYPDTMVHRILSLVLDGNFDMITSDSFSKSLQQIALHSSEREVAADRCEKEANKMRMAQYMSKDLYKEFMAKISGFTKYGMFVQLDNLVEGRVGFETMDDYYNYDENLEIIVGQRSKKVYKLGDKVQVKLVRCDSEAREIDFEVVKKKVMKK